MAKTKYEHVFRDSNDNIFIELSLGSDKITGKRIKKKARKALNGKKFETEKEAHIEAVRIKNEFLQSNGYSNYDMTYEQFMNQVYLPFYETDVGEGTFDSRKSMLKVFINRFGKKKLKDITVQDVQHFRTWLLSKRGANYSQAYASSGFSMFKGTLEFAVNMQYLTVNVASKVKPIPKGRAIVEYWTREEFEQVISKIYIDDFYEHLCFVLIWVYFNTGVRVNEGCALWWNDINFQKKEMRVNHMLLLKSKTDWTRQKYTKTNSGNRIITLDDDTVEILKVWKKRQQELGIKDFVFSYDGYPMIKSTISRIIARYAKLADVPVIQTKGLRHSHASYLINDLNANVLVLSKRMGHSSPEITLRHYSHLWSGVDKELALEMTGKIAIKPAQQKFFYFNGNQAVKYKK
ncbi:TPA: site-specific integrase [Enterococcus faecalis]|nr:site-specific integrase [Enterococcus faecalis]